MTPDPTLADTAYVVEATRNEQHLLWRQFKLRVPWVGRSPGLMPTAGKVTVDGAEHPVVLSIFWAEIAGKLVAFYEPTSRVVDHDLVKRWLAERCPAFAAGKTCDANNFHLCLHDVAPGARLADDDIPTGPFADLLAFAVTHKLRDNWHEPDEQEVTATVVGEVFDNAFGPKVWSKDDPNFQGAMAEFLPQQEIVVRLRAPGDALDVNLADLLALATIGARHLSLADLSTLRKRPSAA